MEEWFLVNDNDNDDDNDNDNDDNNNNDNNDNENFKSKEIIPWISIVGSGRGVAGCVNRSWKIRLTAMIAASFVESRMNKLIILLMNDNNNDVDE